MIASKLLEILDKTDFLIYFRLSHDIIKVCNWDEIWKKITEDNDWKFIPSI